MALIFQEVVQYVALFSGAIIIMRQSVIFRAHNAADIFRGYRLWQYFQGYSVVVLYSGVQHIFLGHSL